MYDMHAVFLPNPVFFVRYEVSVVVALSQLLPLIGHRLHSGTAAAPVGLDLRGTRGVHWSPNVALEQTTDEARARRLRCSTVPSKRLAQPKPEVAMYTNHL